MDYQGITIDLRIRPVRAIRLSINREAQVVLTVPAGVRPDEIDGFLDKNSGWLKKNLEVARKRYEKQTAMVEHTYLDGDIFTLLGREYKLRIVRESNPEPVVLSGDELLLYELQAQSVETRCRLINRWYSMQFRSQITDLVSYWSKQMGVEPIRGIVIKNMKSKWGRCTPSLRELCFNSNLIFYPCECIESVVVHELCHLKEPSHNKRFHELLEGYLPDNREREQVLKSRML